MAMLVGVLVGSTTAEAAEDGSVEATVTVQAQPVCITVSVAAINFGTLAFNTVNNPASPYQIQSCGSQGVDVDVRGTNAAGSSGAEWLLSQSFSCPTTSTFSVTVTTPGEPARNLQTTDFRFITALPSGSFRTVDTSLKMPCDGSSGAGQTMSFTIVYTALAR